MPKADRAALEVAVRTLVRLTGLKSRDVREEMLALYWKRRERDASHE